MTTFPTHSSPAGAVAGASSDTDPLRLRLAESPSAGRLDGAWWPRSRDLHVEVRQLVDHFPVAVGRINRLLYSRPDWDDAVVDGRGVRKVACTRGPVKVGSFPGDDTRSMVLTMADGHRIRLQVVQASSSAEEGARMLAGAGAAAPTGDEQPPGASRDGA
jgi:hypothetical protein